MIEVSLGFLVILVFLAMIGGLTLGGIAAELIARIIGLDRD